MFILMSRFTFCPFLATGPVPFVISSNTVPPGSFLFFVYTISILFYKIKCFLQAKTEVTCDQAFFFFVEGRVPFSHHKRKKESVIAG